MTTMSSHKQSKLNHLLRHWARGSLAVQPWLDTMGISRQLANRYCESQWLQRVGSGVYQLVADEVDWLGAVYTLQSQLNFKIHIGALSALELQGYAHYVPLGNKQAFWLLKDDSEPKQLPKWFSDLFATKNKITYLTRHLFSKPKVGLTEIMEKKFQLKISTPERAILECTELTPNLLSIEHVKNLMENMSTLRPDLVQELLEACRSVKAKRLFMLLAEHCEHPWLKRLDLNKIDFGSGKRVLGHGGYFYSKYNLSIPISLDEHEGYQMNDD